MATRFVNLTPHPLTVYRLDEGGALFTLAPSSPTPFRLTETDTHAQRRGLAVYGDMRIEDWMPEGNYFLGVPVVLRQLEVPETLPMPVANVVYVVSLPALMGLRAAGCTRSDIVAPDTGGGKWGAVRNEKGEVVGVRRFVSLGQWMPDADNDTWAGTIAQWEEAQAEAEARFGKVWG